MFVYTGCVRGNDVGMVVGDGGYTRIHVSMDACIAVSIAVP